MASCYAKKSLLLLLLVSLLLGYGVIELHASHHVYNESYLRSVVTSQSSSLVSDDQPYRTAYHFQPLKNWINDPNGPMIYNGIYHLFYQYNPNGAVWAPPVWGHSTSTDLVNWAPQPLTMEPEIEANINGSWSGSATIDLPGNNNVGMLYTGLNSKYEQVQVLAYPKNLSDPYLKEWYSAPKNPVMYPTPENKINASSFRDPTTAWKLQDGVWRVLVGSKTGTTGTSLLFKSEDFVNWFQTKDPIYQYQLSGMWECPDFFPVYKNGKRKGVDVSKIGTHNVKHVLKVSLDDTKHDVYTIGTYHANKDAYTPDVGFMNDSSLRYDYGKYYASKTFFDHLTKRRILLGWANESSSIEADVEKGWSGIHTIPRSVWLDKQGKQLIQWPIHEIEALRGKPIRIHSQVIKGGSTIEIPGVTASQADVEITFGIRDLKNIEKFEPSWADPQLLCSQKGSSVEGGLGPFGLLTLASKDLQEYTAVFFRVFKSHDKNFVVLMCSDQSRSSLNPTPDKTTYGTFMDVDPIREGLSLRILIDHSVVESFGGKGKNVITSRVYPILATYNNANMYAFNYGTTSVKIKSLTAWSMKKANIA